MDGRELLQVLPASFPQGPGCLPYVSFIACYVVALVTVDDSTFLVFGVLVLGPREYLLNGCVSLEVYLNAILTDVFATFSCALSVWNDYLFYCVDGSWVSIGCACVLIVVDLGLIVVICVVLIIALFLPVAIENFILNLIDGPRGVPAPAHCIPKVSKFLLKELWVSANCFSPVGECTHDTLPGRKTMMTVPLQVLVSVGGFAIHCYG